jgi:hypothetical protein
MPTFYDQNIAKLFGAEAAEDEPEDRFISTVATRDSGDDFTKLVEYWKQGIFAIIARHDLGEAANDLLNKDKIGGFASRVATFIPAIAAKLSQKLGIASNEVNRTVVENFKKTGVIHVYIDDIDRGWSASKSDIKNISALLNAMRDISGADRRIRFRIGLRSDVYFLVRTSDESTDKIEANVVWLSWSNHEILCIMAKRIETFFNIERDQRSILLLNQTDITKNIFSKVIEPTFAGRGHWSNRPIHNVLLSLTRQRPRDLVKLMHGAAKMAAVKNNQIISSTNLESSFEEYSNERLQDIINEFRSELPQIERLLLGMKPTKKERTAAKSYLFTNDTLSKNFPILWDM